MKKTGFDVSKKQTEDIAVSINSILKLPEDTSVGVYLTKRKQKIPDFIMVFQEALGMLLLKEIEPSTFKILACFWFKMQYSNHVGIDQKTIAEESHLALATVKKGIDQLKKYNIIISYDDPQDKRRNIYIMNPNTVWKGTEKERRRVISKINPNQLLLPFYKDLQ